MAGTTQEPFVGEDISPVVKCIFIIIGFTYILVGTCGNLLIIVTVATQKTLRNLHNMYIVNLALSDIIILSYVIIYNQVDLMSGRYPVVQSAHCVFNGFLVVCAYVTSLLTLTVISINRYLNICHAHLYHRLFTKLTTLGTCVAIWIVSALISLPPLLGWGLYRYDRKGHYCGYDRTASLGFTLFLLLASIAVPALIIFACNFLIFRFIRRSKVRVGLSGGQFNRPPNASDIAVIKMLFAVFLCFAVLMSPYMVTTIADLDNSWPAVVHLTCAYTSFSNSCVNSFLYGVMNRNFREGYRRLVCFWRRGVSQQTGDVAVCNPLPARQMPGTDPSAVDIDTGTV